MSTELHVRANGGSCPTDCLRKQAAGQQLPCDTMILLLKITNSPCYKGLHGIDPQIPRTSGSS
ncbi:hypothetical protein [Yinghuangia soli]|uniref:Uncharacterized protein n=1 Tax=Yinghuangia soli TaxID=2908204 RepID=A0AA41Q6J5_9ACTN|nr:hypothetical protein [Yinghuangia soli]MCF2532196.1 hypothetical protein [Yinghuangia soli]